MTDNEKINSGICPCCDNRLVFAEGCIFCNSCSWSGCSG